MSNNMPSEKRKEFQAEKYEQIPNTDLAENLLSTEEALQRNISMSDTKPEIQEQQLKSNDYSTFPPTQSSKGEVRRMQDVSNDNLVDVEDDGTCNLCQYIVSGLAWLVVIIIPIFWFFCFKTVRNYEKALIFRLGKLQGKARGPGLFIINPLTDKIFVIDLRMQADDDGLPPQDMMTRDSVTVTVDAIAFYRVIDPIRCVLEVQNYKYAFNMIAATTLRAVVGSYNLASLLSDRDEINERVRTTIEQETSGWGVVVPAVEIKDVRLPFSMQRAMAAEAEADREKKAKIISAEGERDSAKMLAIAANLISKSPGALQLRYLHTLAKISEENNNTVVFPLPIELMTSLMKMSGQTISNSRRKNIDLNENNNNNNVIGNQDDQKENE